MKLNFTLKFSRKAQRGSRGISVLFNLSARGDGWLIPPFRHFAV
jgi:hypothetical protein